MSGRFALPYITALDGNGKPISGAILEFYESGTTTPKSAYKDATLSSPWSSGSDKTDANGRATIYLASDAPYRVIVKDAAGNIITTQDGITPSGSIVNINTLKKIRLEDQSTWIPNAYNSDTGSGVSNHLAYADCLDKMLLDETAVFEGNNLPIYLDTNIGGKGISPRAKFYWEGTRIYADTRPGGAYNTGGLLTLTGQQDTDHENLVINGLCEHRITSIAVSGTTATVTTADAHGYVANQLTGIWRVEVPNGTLTTAEQILATRAFNGRKTVATVPTTTTFTFTVPAGTPTNPVVTRARCSWTKNLLFGGDGMRFFLGQRVRLRNVLFESINDAYLRFTSTTNNSAIQANPNLPVAAGFLEMINCRTINCVQGSTSFGGAYNVSITGHQSEYSKAAAFKYASQLAGGGLFRFQGTVRDTVACNFNGFDAAHPNAYSGSAFVAEGVEKFEIDLQLENCIEGGTILPNRDADAEATDKITANGYIKIRSYGGGNPNTDRLWPMLRIEDNDEQTTLLDGNRNLHVDIQCDKQRGSALRVGNNLGYMGAFSGKVKATDCVTGTRYRSLYGGDINVEFEFDGLGSTTAFQWVTNTKTYKVTDGMIVKTAQGGTEWRCDVTPGTNSTIAPTGTGTVATADGYTWKYIGTTAGNDVDADESPSTLNRANIKLVGRNNPNGIGNYVSKINNAVIDLTAFNNTGFGNDMQALTSCTLNLKSDMNSSSQNNATGFVDSEIFSLSADCNNNGFTALTVDSLDGLYISSLRSIKNCNGTAGININGKYLRGLKIDGVTAYQDSSNSFDFLISFARAYKHLVDTCHLDIGVPGISDIAAAGGTVGFYPGGSRVRLHSFGSTLQKGGASAGTMGKDVINSGVYVTSAFAAGAPPTAVRLYGANTFTAGCGWVATNNTISGKRAVWDIINYGEAGATGNLAAEPAADTFGIVDGGTINTNAHWALYLDGRKDLGSTLSPFWATGQTVQPGDSRVNGFAITTLTGNGTTATATKAAHGLTTGDKGYICRATGDFNTRNLPGADGANDFYEITVTVVDVNTFTFPSAGTGTAAPSTGNTDIAFSRGCYLMVAPNARTTGATAPSGRGIVNGNYFLAFAGSGVTFA